MPKVGGSGSVVQLEKGKPPGKCRKWEIRVSVGRDDKTGKYKTVTKRFSGTLSEANAFKRDLIRDIERGSVARSASMRFDEYAEAWLKDREGSVAPGTLAKNRHQIENVSMHIGGMRLSQIDVSAVERVYRSLLEGGGKSGRPLSGAYVNGISCTLHRLFRQAVKDGHIAANPCDFADAPQPDTEEKKALSFDQMKDLISKLDPAEPSQFVVLMMLKTGLRRGEVHGLSVGDVDFVNHQVSVVHNFDDIGNLKAPKTRKSRRDIAITASAEGDVRLRIESIERRFEEVRERLGTSEPVLTDGTPLCCNDVGERMMPHSSTRWWSRNRARFGLEGWTLYEMRHSYLSEMARRNTDVKILQELAGHAKFSTTMDIYAHVGMDDKRRALENVDW